MRATFLLMLTAVSSAAFGQVCPPDMGGITTSNNTVLRAAGHADRGYRGGRLGDPNTASDNWLNGIYNNFLTPQAEGHFFYEHTINPPSVPFMGNDSEWDFGMCSSQGQCVQASIQVEFDQLFIPAYVRQVLRRQGYFIPAGVSLNTIPRQVNVRYTAPNGNQFSKSVQPNTNGTLPSSLPTQNRTSGNGGCLNNEGRRSSTHKDNDGDDYSEDEEENENHDEYEEDYEAHDPPDDPDWETGIEDPDEDGEFPDWHEEL